MSADIEIAITDRWELERRIAKEVFGWSEAYGPGGCPPGSSARQMVPDYSSDIGAAMLILEDWDGVVRINRDSSDVSWEVEFAREFAPECWLCRGANDLNLPMAIVRARLAEEVVE